MLNIWFPEDFIKFGLTLCYIYLYVAYGICNQVIVIMILCICCCVVPLV